MSELLALAGRNVPRYTSYPTAPQFTAGVTAATCAAWLGELAPDDTLSLYLHVPYCTNLCLYCGCHTKVMRRQDPLERYAALLAGEIMRTGELTAARSVKHLHWGGGTPSILGGDRLARITDRIGATFDLAAVEEHAIELDPRHVPADLVQALARIGVNRASLGVQTFAPHVQEAIGRVQPFAQVRKAVALLREAGIAHISMDLMYGLPHQSARDIAETVELADMLEPDRIALFGYAHVPWFKARQRLIDAAALPGAAARLEQAQVAANALTGLGYVAIGLDHFAHAVDTLARAARGGALHRNFQGYTTDAADALLGFGASAIGRLPQGYVQNAGDLGTWARAVEAGHLATARGLALTTDDRVRGCIIETLMCTLAVDLEVIAAEFAPLPVPDFAAELAELEPLRRRELVEIAGRRIVVTEAGRPFLRLVAAAFDAWLPHGGARHSIAV
jgi:oxygen-independent coproporphyrinogen-3 oxidase